MNLASSASFRAAAELPDRDDEIKDPGYSLELKPGRALIAVGIRYSAVLVATDCGPLLFERDWSKIDAGELIGGIPSKPGMYLWEGTPTQSFHMPDDFYYEFPGEFRLIDPSEYAELCKMEPKPLEDTP